ncbi:MAG TPA: hypothetical protein VGM88_11470 [Kofleriaceae bacterium]
MTKDSRQTGPAPGGQTEPADAPTPGKSGLPTSEGGADSSLLTPKKIERAQRSNPYYYAQLKYTPSIFNAGTDVASREFALGVARVQKSKNDKAIHVDGIAGPATVHAVQGAGPAPEPTPGPTPGPAPGPAPTPGPTPGPAPAPTPTHAGPTPPTPAGPTPAPAPTPPAPAPVPQPRTEKTEYGTFYVYPDDFVGPLPPNDASGDRLHESDFKKELAKREAAGEKQRDKTIKSVDDLLSYGAFDWVITDAEATKALNLLAALPPTQLKLALAKINTGRLLDNLPSAQRKTPAFAKVIVAMGPDKYRPFIKDLLSYGVLDWAITDADAQTVTDILSVLPAPEQAKFLRSLDQKHLGRLASNLSKGVHLSNDLMKVIFDTLPDTDVADLKSVFERRFNTSLSVGFFQRWVMSIKSDWDAPGVRRLWTICAQLPPGHIENNPKLESLLRGDTNDGSGYYSPDEKSSVVGYSDPATKVGSYGAIMVDDGTGTGHKKDVGLNSNVNLFSTVVRHEIGHSVDAKIGASAPGGYVHTAANAGTWNSYGSSKPWVDAIIAAGGGMSGHGYADEDKYKKAMYKAVDSAKNFVDALKDVDSKVAAPADPNKGPIAAVYDLTRWHDSKNPWYSNPDRQDVGGRLWQRPYGSGDYVSFVKSARATHGVSGYQFRAPGEWFAEAYAVYYSDQDGPAGTPVGTRLRTRDTAAADWYDKNVDKGYSLSHETGQKGGGAGGAGTAPGGGAGGARPDGGGAGGAGPVARGPGGGAGGGA